jgi:hypothetical protein
VVARQLVPQLTELVLGFDEHADGDVAQGV